MNSLSKRALAAAALVVLSAPGWAQDAYPSKPIKAIVPFAAGSATDIVSRMFAEHMGRALGQNIVIENRAGASGMTGADAVAKAAPDGYTVLFGTNSTNAAAPALFKAVPFDHEKDFAPVSFLCSVPLVVGVPKDSPAKVLPDLIAMAKAKPGEITFANASTSQRVSTEMLASMAGVKLNMVPYRSSPNAITDLIGGRVNLFTADLAVMLPQVRDGSVRALAVTSLQRSPLLPDVPTVEEAGGYKGYELIAWFGLFAPAGTPPAIIARLNEAVHKAAADTSLKARLSNDMGMVIAPGTPAELAAQVRTEGAKWAKVVADAGIEKQ
ncbi:MAG: tripartite tricarboxylate transporter substrate binding protein [Beijerinckiaceae bacterium]